MKNMKRNWLKSVTWLTIGAITILIWYNFLHWLFYRV